MDGWPEGTLSYAQIWLSCVCVSRGPANGPYTITLSGSELPQITGEVAIQGPGAGLLAVSGGNQSRIFDIASGATASLSGLTLAGGFADVSPDQQPYGYDGGAVINAGTLTISDSTLTGNTAQQNGGAIYNRGVLTVANSTLWNNSAPQGGGGIVNVAGATLRVTDSTLYKNSGYHGGGVFDAGHLTLIDSTLSGNTANASSQPGAGVYLLPDGGNTPYARQTTITLKNTIISGNLSPNASGNYDLSGSPERTTTYLHNPNLIGASQVYTLEAAPQGDDTSDIFNSTPDLLRPRLLRRPTETLAPRPGSPAIGAGNPSGPDQRGVAAGSYIGAVQTQSSITVNSSDDAATVRRAIRPAVASTPSTFPMPTAAAASTSTSPKPDHDRPFRVRVAADHRRRRDDRRPGGRSLTISGNYRSRIFAIGNDAVVTISGLTVEYGFSPGSGDGIENLGTLTLSDSTVSGSSAPKGGGIYSSHKLFLNNSTISGNTRPRAGRVQPFWDTPKSRATPLLPTPTPRSSSPRRRHRQPGQHGDPWGVHRKQHGGRSRRRYLQLRHAQPHGQHGQRQHHPEERRRHRQLRAAR